LKSYLTDLRVHLFDVFTRAGLINSTEFSVKAISDDIAKIVAEYMVHKFGKTAASSQQQQLQQQQRYISMNNNSTAGKHQFPLP